ncbi:hypothetical protein AF72_02675 [Xylella taiwanensis]|uniref:Uncharacterized protein n=1 Tax=Xylella taiwanensis TaxID=1444770 RepID=Z9JL31_9GAMM|nr:hypothetical protein AF72_02675 [Xylella taiwanensis]
MWSREATDQVPAQVLQKAAIALEMITYAE